MLSFFLKITLFLIAWLKISLFSVPQVATKSVKQCVQFYYVWKKVCPDDYRRLRLARNKQGDYNTRRQTERVAAAAAAVAAEKAALQQQQQQLQLQQHQLQQQQMQEHQIDMKQEVKEEVNHIVDGGDSDNTSHSGVSETDDGGQVIMEVIEIYDRGQVNFWEKVGAW